MSAALGPRERAAMLERAEAAHVTSPPLELVRCADDVITLLVVLEALEEECPECGGPYAHGAGCPRAPVVGFAAQATSPPSAVNHEERP